MNARLNVLFSKIPTSYNFCQFSNVQLGIVDNKYVTGKVVKKSGRKSDQCHSWLEVALLPLNRDGCSLGRRLFKALFLDRLSHVAQNLNAGDYVALAGFKVEEMDPPEVGFYFKYLVLPETTGQVWIEADKQPLYIKQNIIQSKSSPRFFDCLAMVRKWEASVGGCYKLTVCDQTWHRLNLEVNGALPQQLEKDCLVHLKRLKVRRVVNTRSGTSRVEVGSYGHITATIDSRNIEIIPIALVFDPDSARIYTKERDLVNWYHDTFFSFTSLSDLALGHYGNVVCQVASISILPRGPCTVLQVWDGTRPRNLRHYQPVSWKSVEMSDVLVGLVEFYLCDIWVYDEHAISAANLQPEDVIVLHNLHMAGNPVPRYILHYGNSHGRGIQLLPRHSATALRLLNTLHPLLGFPYLERDDEPNTPPEPGTSGQLGLSAMYEDSDDPPSSPEPSANISVTAAANEDEDDSSFIINPQLGRANQIGVSERDEGPISRLTGLCSHPTELDLISAEPPFYAHRILKVLTVRPAPECPLEALWWHCATCSHMSSYEVGSSGVTCPTCRSRKLELCLLVLMELLDGEEVLEVLLQGHHAETFFHQLTPKDIAEDPQRFSALLARLIRHLPTLECCIYAYRSLLSHTLRYEMRNTVLE